MRWWMHKKRLFFCHFSCLRCIKVFISIQVPSTTNGVVIMILFLRVQLFLIKFFFNNSSVDQRLSVAYLLIKVPHYTVYLSPYWWKWEVLSPKVKLFRPRNQNFFFFYYFDHETRPVWFITRITEIETDFYTDSYYR